MDYYDPLRTAWNGATLPAGVTGETFVAGDTTAQKLAKINGWTVAGPSLQDVAAAAVMMAWYESGAWNKVFARSLEDLAGDASDPARIAAKGFVAQVQRNGVFSLSQPGVSTRAQGDLSVLVTIGDLAPSDVNAALALGTVHVLWTTAPVAQGGAGLSSLVNAHDLCGAGLIDEATANEIELAGY
jgi:hypothetical protein